MSFFGGPGWTWEPRRGQFYQHTFLAQQPDLNWREPAVEAAQWAMVRGWLDRGVDGFRLDVFNAFLKHPDLPLEPGRSRGSTAWTRQVHVHDRDQPDFVELLERFRALVDAEPGPDDGRRAVRRRTRAGGGDDPAAATSSSTGS